jgi:hypothetical protein
MILKPAIKKSSLNPSTHHLFFCQVIKKIHKETLREGQEVNFGVAIGGNFRSKKHCFQSNSPPALPPPQIAPMFFLNKIHARSPLAL